MAPPTQIEQDAQHILGFLVARRNHADALRRRRRRRLGLALALIVGAAGAAAVAVWQLGGSRPSAVAAAARLASALERGRFAGVDFANTSGAEAAASWRSIRAGMGTATASVSAGQARTHGDKAVVGLRWRWRLPFGWRWTYATRVSLRYSGGAWKPVWSPTIVNASLGGDRVLELSVRQPPRAQPPRAPILAVNGQPIVTSRPIVNVGIEPKRVRSLPELVRRLHALLGVQAQPLLRAVRSAAPGAFVPVVTLRRAQYEQLRGKLYPLPGAVFTTGTLPLAPTRAFARSLLGTVGPATAEIVSSARGRVLAGEVVGLSGLERAFEARLGGRPGLVVQAVGRGSAGGRLTLYAVTDRPGRPLRTTLEIPAQEAADAALARLKQPSALVAVRVSSGGVIAVSVGPDPGGYDIALQGEYPPGSTFKVVTTLALLERGLRPSETVDCPAQITADGKQFRNAEQEVLGPTSFAQDFADSCNTAFVSLAPRVAGNALPAAARALGLGRGLKLGVPTFSGSVPPPADPVGLAAEAFGQGRILVSPLAMAGLAAALARGRWQSPRLLLDPVPARFRLGPKLPPAAVVTLRALLREVVTSGTGTALAAQPGPPVYGKTGTAEVGAQQPPRTDAWFIGYQGDVAFAALVADTNNGSGGTVAAPLVGRFLSRLGQR